MIGVVTAAIVPIVILVSIGFVLSRRQFLDPAFLVPFSQLAFRFFIPCLLFAGIYEAEVSVSSLAQYWSGYFIPVLIFFGILTLWEQPLFALAITYANTVMVGIPLVVQTWGNEGLNIAIAVISLNSLTLFFAYASMTALQGSGDGRSLNMLMVTLRNPIILALVAGVGLNMWGVALAAPLLDAVRLAGRAGLPCALLILGATLARFATHSGKEQRKRVVLICVTKLLLIPAAVYLFARWALDLSTLVTGVLVLLAACPGGINVLPFAQNSVEDTEMVSAGIFVSTLASIVTLPFWVYLVG